MSSNSLYCGPYYAEEFAKHTEVKDEFTKYVEIEKGRLRKQPQATTWWYSSTDQLLRQTSTPCDARTLHDLSVYWSTKAADKADLLAQSFESKYKLEGGGKQNYYLCLWSRHNIEKQSACTEATGASAEQLLKALREDSAAGPDLLSVRILK